MSNATPIKEQSIIFWKEFKETLLSIIKTVDESALTGIGKTLLATAIFVNMFSKKDDNKKEG